MGYVFFSGDAFLHGYVWQAFTYPWVYPPVSAPLMAFIFHALGLWLFGSPVEGEIGTRRFYQVVGSSVILGALAAALVTALGHPVFIFGLAIPLFAISMTFCFLHADETINFLLLVIMIPIRGRYLGVVLMALAFASNLALIPSFLAALGGTYLVVVKRWWPDWSWSRKSKARPSRLSSLPTGKGNITPLRPAFEASKSSAAESEVDRILDKLRTDGMAGLTPQEKETLDRHSSSLRSRDEGSR